MLAAGRRLMLEKGFPATTVDQICEAAGVTKGAFFHYFESKDAVGRTVIERFVSDLVEAFGAGPFRHLPDPLERVDAYIDFTAQVCQETILRDGCILGLFSQELAQTNPAIRAVCDQSFRAWADDLRSLLDEAAAGRIPASSFDSESLAEQYIAIVEGALILRKAYQDPEVVVRALNHFRDYTRLLLAPASSR